MCQMYLKTCILELTVFMFGIEESTDSWHTEYPRDLGAIGVSASRFDRRYIFEVIGQLIGLISRKVHFQ